MAPSRPDAVADVALLLEGTYPFVTGGVSGWVDQIIRGLPELKFSLFFIGGSRESYGAPRYQVPANVVHLECLYLMAPPRTSPRLHAGGCPHLELNSEVHAAFRDRAPLTQLLPQLAEVMGRPDGISEETFLHSEAAWDAICEQYETRCTHGSFLDYFWAVRMMHSPLYTLAASLDRLPEARLFHSISTGYAGFLGALLHYRRRRPLIVTEHGIYTKERRIDLAHAPWIREEAGLFSGNAQEAGYLRQLWVRFYESLGRCAYTAARPIISLYEGNRQRQITDGAEAERTRVIPNGIDIARFSALRQRRPAKTPRVLGLLGRVVPIKDVRTFIRAMRSVCDRLTGAEGWIVGPTSEDEAYARECTELIRMLGLEQQVKLLGFRKPDEVLPNLGVIMLTSISEALPLCLLEAFASGLPAVATDVGACRELIEGRTEEDRALGLAGAVTPIASPQATADAAVALLTDETRWRSAQAAGQARVERFYTDSLMLNAYRDLYAEAGSWQA